MRYNTHISFFLAIAEVFNNEGDEALIKKEYHDAIHFYTEGIKINCADKELNAKLYGNRATANNCLGEYFCLKK